MTGHHRRERVNIALGFLGDQSLRMPTQFLQQFTRMPPTRRYAPPYSTPVGHRVRRVRSLVPPLIAQPTGRDDVARRILTTITASIEMLGGALQAAGLRAREAELISKRLYVRQPHGLTAVVATPVLALES